MKLFTSITLLTAFAVWSTYHLTKLAFKLTWAISKLVYKVSLKGSTKWAH